MPRLNSAAYNIKEIKKIYLMLEEMLEDDDFCMDCIKSNLLKVEALAEEAVMMDPKSKWNTKCKEIAKVTRDTITQFIDGRDIYLIAKDIQKLREKLG